jgi:thioesterase domain-containing protein
VLGQIEKPDIPALVLLKAGSHAPPIFIAPGGAENAQTVFPLGARIQSRHPAYAIQTRGIDGASTNESVEDMAQFCLDTIKEVQARGPYILVGYSLGGLVMLEVANRLRERGEQVAFCALLDTYPHPRYWPMGCRIRFIAQRVGHHANKLKSLSWRAVIPYVITRYKLFLELLRLPGRHKINDTFWDSPKERLGNVAWIRHLPRYYNGRITFLRAESTTTFPKDPKSVWRKLVAGLEIHTVPGDHRTMFDDYFESLASQLSACLREID